MGFKGEFPKNHYTIFKNITRYKYIDCKKLEKLLDIKLIEFGLNSENKNTKICSSDDFRNKVLPYVSQKNQIGIPQGTTISDVIANFYMTDFDITMKKLCKKYNGYYRRYSDDILIVCAPKHKEYFIKISEFLIKKTGKTICIGKHKTTISNFTFLDNKTISCETEDHSNNSINKPFSYLGLSYDGRTTRIRNSTISGFYKKVSERIETEALISYTKLCNREEHPYSDRIFSIISFDMIKNSYMENRDNDDDFTGNFYSYVKRFSDITGYNEQLRMFENLPHWIKKRARKCCDKLEASHPHVSRRRACG